MTTRGRPAKRELSYRQYPTNLDLKDRSKRHKAAIKTELMLPKDFPAELAYRDHQIRQLKLDLARLLEHIGETTE